MQEHNENDFSTKFDMGITNLGMIYWLRDLTNICGLCFVERNKIVLSRKSLKFVLNCQYISVNLLKIMKN